MNKQNENFIKKFIVPAFMGLIKQNMIFCIQDLSGKIILSSQKYRNLFFTKSPLNTLNKKEEVKLPFIYENSLFSSILNENIKEPQKPIDFISTINEQLYLITCEPLFNNNKILAIKNYFRPFRIISHRELTYIHFKKFEINIAALSDIHKPKLTEKEKVVLFMLITGYNQKEIANYIRSSRSLVAKIISNGLCPKFNIAGSASKILIDKAISLGLASFIPKEFIYSNLINS